MVKTIIFKTGAVLFCAFLMAGLFTPAVKAMDLLQLGSKGGRVAEVQNYLGRLNYLRASPTGYFGKLTTEAVKKFQVEHHLAVDGVIGPMTMDALREAVSGSNRKEEYMNHNANQNSRNRPGGIQTLSWSLVNQLWRNGEIARIIDLETGKSFQAKRLYGYYHADIEPLTKEDTRIMKEIYGGKWSWDRRAVVIQVKNFLIAASINGMPHGGQSIYNNDFAGQFCAHFLGSRVHQTGRVDPVHHAMIKQAALVFNAAHNNREFVPIMTELEEAKTNLPRF